MISASSIEKQEKCNISIKAKSTRKPFSSEERKDELLDLIHTAVCDLNGILTRGGKRYFVTFIDDFSKFTYVYLIWTKDEVLEKFKIYKAKIENQLKP